VIWSRPPRRTNTSVIQEIGREKIFADYRIRIAQVIYEARPGKPIWQPERRTPYNDPARRRRTYVIATESKDAALPVATHWRRDSFERMYRQGSSAFALAFGHLIACTIVQDEPRRIRLLAFDVLHEHVGLAKMSVDQAIAFFVFAIVVAITPGPSNR